jgi:hypothetical protein
LTDKSPTPFHPELEAAFDAAQDAPATLRSGDAEIVAMSVTSFEALIEKSSIEASDVRHQRIDRGDKPDVILLEPVTYNNFVQINGFFGETAETAT